MRRRRPPERCQWQISRWKNDLLGTKQALARTTDAAEAATARLYADYQRSLRAYNPRNSS